MSQKWFTLLSFFPLAYSLNKKMNPKDVDFFPQRKKAHAIFHCFFSLTNLHGAAVSMCDCRADIWYSSEKTFPFIDFAQRLLQFN